MACTRFNARLGLCLLCLYFSVPLPHKFKSIDDSFKPNIEGTDTREKEANLYYTGLNIYLGSRMSHCNNSDEIITKSNIFRTEIARTEASSLNLPLQNTQLPNYFNRNEFQVQQKKMFLQECFLPNYLASARRKHLPICVVHSFASQISCECIIGRACSQAPLHALFCWYTRSPLALVSKTNSLLGTSFSFLVSLICM